MPGHVGKAQKKMMMAMPQASPRIPTWVAGGVAYPALEKGRFELWSLRSTN